MWLSAEEAREKAHAENVQRFDKYSSLWRNVKDAVAWVSDVQQVDSVSSTQLQAECVADKTESCHGASGPVIREGQQPDGGQGYIDVSELLCHKQISHVQQASNNVTRRMNSFHSCQ